MENELDQTAFQEKAEITLQALVDAVEIADEEGEIDIDFIEGVVNIILPDNQEYVINLHTPSRQIWVSSPFSGSTKFSYDPDEGEWLPEIGRNLRDFLSIEFSKSCNLDVEF